LEALIARPHLVVAEILFELRAGDDENLRERAVLVLVLGIEVVDRPYPNDRLGARGSGEVRCDVAERIDGFRYAHAVDEAGDVALLEQKAESVPALAAERGARDTCTSDEKTEGKTHGHTAKTFETCRRSLHQLSSKSAWATARRSL